MLAKQQKEREVNHGDTEARSRLRRRANGGRPRSGLAAFASLRVLPAPCLCASVVNPMKQGPTTACMVGSQARHHDAGRSAGRLRR
jgi:hypothetical protein